jgi:hypothetical protein
LDTRAAQAVRVEKTLEKNEAARLLQPERELLHRAVLDACDTLDGVKDGLISIRSAAPSIQQC